MARRKTPVPAATLAADHEAVKGVQGLPDYQPVNERYSLAHALEVQATLTRAQQAEEELRIALAQAYDTRSDTSHLYHDIVLGMKSQVVAQYGPDAAAVALIGLTRKSQRKQPARRKPTEE
jgi:hypothetical protein